MATDVLAPVGDLPAEGAVKNLMHLSSSFGGRMEPLSFMLDNKVDDDDWEERFGLPVTRKPRAWKLSQNDELWDMGSEVRAQDPADGQLVYTTHTRASPVSHQSFHGSNVPCLKPYFPGNATGQITPTGSASLNNVANLYASPGLVYRPPDGWSTERVPCTLHTRQPFHRLVGRSAKGQAAARCGRQAPAQSASGANLPFHSVSRNWTFVATTADGVVSAFKRPPEDACALPPPWPFGGPPSALCDSNREPQHLARHLSLTPTDEAAQALHWAAQHARGGAKQRLAATPPLLPGYPAHPIAPPSDALKDPAAPQLRAHEEAAALRDPPQVGLGIKFGTSADASAQAHLASRSAEILKQTAPSQETPRRLCDPALQEVSIPNLDPAAPPFAPGVLRPLPPTGPVQHLVSATTGGTASDVSKGAPSVLRAKPQRRPRERRSASGSDFGLEFSQSLRKVEKAATRGFPFNWDRNALNPAPAASNRPVLPRVEPTHARQHKTDSCTQHRLLPSDNASSETQQPPTHFEHSKSNARSQEPLPSRAATSAVHVVPRQHEDNAPPSFCDVPSRGLGSGGGNSRSPPGAEAGPDTFFITSPRLDASSARPPPPEALERASAAAPQPRAEAPCPVDESAPGGEAAAGCEPREDAPEQSSCTLDPLTGSGHAGNAPGKAPLFDPSAPFAVEAAGRSSHQKTRKVLDKVSLAPLIPCAAGSEEDPELSSPSTGCENIATPPEEARVMRAGTEQILPSGDSHCALVWAARSSDQEMLSVLDELMADREKALERAEDPGSSAMMISVMRATEALREKAEEAYDLIYTSQHSGAPGSAELGRGKQQQAGPTTVPCIAQADLLEFLDRRAQAAVPSAVAPACSLRHCAGILSVCEGALLGSPLAQLYPAARGGLRGAQLPQDSPASEAGADGESCAKVDDMVRPSSPDSAAPGIRRYEWVSFFCRRDDTVSLDYLLRWPASIAAAVLFHKSAALCESIASKQTCSQPSTLSLPKTGQPGRPHPPEPQRAGTNRLPHSRHGGASGKGCSRPAESALSPRPPPAAPGGKKKAVRKAAPGGGSPGRTGPPADGGGQPAEKGGSAALAKAAFLDAWQRAARILPAAGPHPAAVARALGVVCPLDAPDAGAFAGRAAVGLHKWVHWFVSGGDPETDLRRAHAQTALLAALAELLSTDTATAGPQPAQPSAEPCPPPVPPSSGSFSQPVKSDSRLPPAQFENGKCPQCRTCRCQCVCGAGTLLAKYGAGSFHRSFRRLPRSASQAAASRPVATLSGSMGRVRPKQHEGPASSRQLSSSIKKNPEDSGGAPPPAQTVNLKERECDEAEARVKGSGILPSGRIGATGATIDAVSEPSETDHACPPPSELAVEKRAVVSIKVVVLKRPSTHPYLNPHAEQSRKRNRVPYTLTSALRRPDGGPAAEAAQATVVVGLALAAVAAVNPCVPPRSRSPPSPPELKTPVHSTAGGSSVDTILSEHDPTYVPGDIPTYASLHPLRPGEVDPYSFKQLLEAYFSSSVVNSKSTLMRR
ncbi:hypothetical protein DIPPA_14006 [Diplonema papillatum]|nr:hypothetical protein DIPPA_14006 [Diplonema papillatum]